MTNLRDTNFQTIEELIAATKQFGDQSEKKRQSEYEKKANENINTSDDSEWYSASGVSNKIKNLVPDDGRVMQFFKRGYLGNNLPDSYPLPYDTSRMYFEGKSEWTATALPTHSPRKPSAANNTLTMKNLVLVTQISNEMIESSTDKGLFDYITEKIAKAADRTLASMIINGDIETGGTGNVNSDDQAPATTFATTGGAADHRLLLDHGIREAAINNSNTVDITTFDSDHILSVVAALGEDYQEELRDILLLANTSSYLEMLTDDALKLAINSSKPALDGVTPQPWGMPLVQTALVPKTEADGKVSATPVNNTKGQFCAVYAPAVLWGMGRDNTFEVVRVAGYGYTIVATMKASFSILDYANTCALGRDMTL